MIRRFQTPIRLKILVALLFIVTGVVGAITLTMANLFHQDKRAYVNDLVSIVALSTAEECRSLLMSYAERVHSFARIIDNEELDPGGEPPLIEGLFRDFPDLVAVAIYDEDAEIVAAYNAKALETAGLSTEALAASNERRLPELRQLKDGEFWVRNTTLSDGLPAMTIVQAVPAEANRRRLLATAVLRLDSLMRAAVRSGGFNIYVVDADGTLLAAADPRLVMRRESAGSAASTELAHAGRATGLALEYERDGVPTTGAYASVNFGGVMAAAEVPSSAAIMASRELLGNLLTVSFVLLLLAAAVGLIWASSLTRPIERLARATREVAKGHFNVEVRVNSKDEIGGLAASFNQMASELRRREQALDEAQNQLVQSEKMAAFGQFSAGIAHEVKNPLAGILGCAQLALRKTEAESSVEQNLKLIEKETKRCKTIIENLLKFARQEKAIQRPIEINPVVEDATAIVNHQLELSKVKLEKQLADGLPQFRGNANQLQQVLMNLMINAQQAMEDRPGHVKVLTRRTDTGQIEIVVSDDGPGMTDAIKAKLFEPFFTTKPGGKGTGLGLSVSFGIIRDHNGEITIDSRPGEGATFTIRIPAIEAGTDAAPEKRPVESREPVGAV
jgi:signal transduction histidine kinase